MPKRPQEHQRFPGNEDRRSFRIRRRLSRPSRQDLAFCSGLSGAFPGQNIRTIERETDLTIVGKMDIVDARKNSDTLREMSFPDLARLVLDPRPASAAESQLMAAESIGLLGVRETVRAVLFLDDKDAVLTDEYGQYTNRLNQCGADIKWRGMLPHVSLALLPANAPRSEVVSWLTERAPENVMLLPVSTDPRLPRDATKV
jgi:hypothetical protein